MASPRLTDRSGGKGRKGPRPAAGRVSLRGCVPSGGGGTRIPQNDGRDGKRRCPPSARRNRSPTPSPPSRTMQQPQQPTRSLFAVTCPRCGGGGGPDGPPTGVCVKCAKHVPPLPRVACVQTTVLGAMRCSTAATMCGGRRRAGGRACLLPPNTARSVASSSACPRGQPRQRSVYVRPPCVRPPPGGAGCFSGPRWAPHLAPPSRRARALQFRPRVSRTGSTSCPRG